MQTVRWSDEATTDLVEIIDDIEQRNALAAQNLLAAIVQSAENLPLKPYSFRLGRVGRYAASAAVPAYCRHIREAAAGRASNGGTLDLVQERAALAKAQRERLEREAAQAAHELVSAKEVKAVWFRLARAARDQLLSLPTRLAPQVAHSDPGRAFDLMTEEIRRTLEQLAAEPVTKATKPDTDETTA